MLQILQYPDLRLRKKGYRVGNVKAIKIQKTVDDMLETLRHTHYCAGLAATQLDLEDPPNITVINLDNESKPPLCLINLQIISTEGTEEDQEGCMSVYPQNDIYAKIKRAQKVKVSALDRHGNKLEFEAKGRLARCLQHEYDHLRGILYIDYLPKPEKELLDKKIAKLTQTK